MDSCGPRSVADVLGEPNPDRDGVDAIRGLYMHVPFCVHKCHYCDFYSIVDASDRRDEFVARAVCEIAAGRRWIGAGPLETVFVGGGTPTMLEPESWGPLGAALRDLVDDRTEFTVEANPETVSEAQLEALRAAGATRLSVGAQSFDAAALKVLERRHRPESVPRAVSLARAAGIESINLDLIFAVPGQTQATWARDLETVLALEPDHLSCYGLVYEPNTAITVRLRQGTIERAAEELEAEMYTYTIERLVRAGYEHYEISNWARPGHRCRHNVLYWTGASWWPIGPSASGSAAGWRWRNVPRLASWLESSDAHGLPPIEDAEYVDDDVRTAEAFMMELRLLDGMPRDRVEFLLSRGTRGDGREETIRREIDAGHLEWRDGSLCLTADGLMIADSVIGALF